MDHSYFIDRISAYYDRDLPPYELEVVREHLEGCPECQQQLKKYQQLDEMVERKSQLDESDYWEKSAVKIEQALGSTTTRIVDIKPTKSSGLIWKAAAVAASIAALTFISLHYSDIEKPVLKQMPPVTVDEGTGRTDDSVNRIFDELDSKNDAPKESRDEFNPKDAPKEDKGAAEKSTVEAELESYETKGAKNNQPEKSSRYQAPSYAAPKPAEPQVRPEEVVADGDMVGQVKEERAKSSVAGDVSSEQFDLSAEEKVAPPPPAVPSIKVTAGKDIAGLSQAGASDSVSNDNFAELRLLRDKRDSLRSAIADYGIRRMRGGIALDSVEVYESPVDSSYNAMLDSTISVVFRIGLLSNDTTEINHTINDLSNFPWNLTDEQQARVNAHLDILRLKLD